MSINNLINASLLLFLDQLVTAGGNWLYWLVISKLTSISELGQATTVLSIYSFISLLTELGLEYPLLKESSNHQSQLLGTSLVIELVITTVSILIIIYLFNSLIQESSQGFLWIVLGMLVCHPLYFVCRFILLGVSEVKWVFLTDVASILIKFVLGYVLVVTGFGVFGVLFSFLIPLLFVGGVTSVLAGKIFGFSLGDMAYMIKIVKGGLVNMPYKLSWTIIFSLSVVLLALYNIQSSEIALFYIALTISLVAGGFVFSTAYMALPASSVSREDLSSSSIRIGISLTAPLIAALIVSPKFILSIIGAEYMSGETVLLVLSIGILPFSIVFNAISKFNYLGYSSKVLWIGAILILTFLVAFFLLVPQYGTKGAAFSIILAFVASSIPSMIWMERAIIKYIVICAIAVVGGWGAGQMLESLGTGTAINHVISILTSLGVCLGIIIVLKNMSVAEIRQIIKISVKNTGSKID